MKKDIALLWTSALRSREFTQCKGKLESNGANCCLGVLCNLALIAGVCDYECKYGYIAFDDSMSVLPESVREWAGLETVSVKLPNTLVSLTYYNDKGYTFEEIAEIIEENYERL